MKTSTQRTSPSNEADSALLKARNDYWFALYKSGLNLKEIALKEGASMALVAFSINDYPEFGEAKRNNAYNRARAKFGPKKSYVSTKRDFSQRHAEMLSLYIESHKTLEEIAGQYSPLSRQRVQQILFKFESYHKEKELRKIRTQNNLKKPCARCGETFQAETHSYSICSRYCAYPMVYMKEIHPEAYKDWKRHKDRIHTVAYYHKVLKHLPDFHDRVRRYNTGYTRRKAELAAKLLGLNNPK